MTARTAVIATAGHVDHGKSALVRALTGTEPDRWAEEHRRGLTIDLGYAWTTLDDGTTISVVDVPGHERFIGNMLAGMGPAATVLFVVAADEGWRRQSEEHLLAIDALGIEHGVLVITRTDLADPAPALDAARERIARSSLGSVPSVAVSARTGAGLVDLRTALADLAAALPEPGRDGRARLWIDRAFTIRGSGTVVTGTLGEGRLEVGAAVSVVASGHDTPPLARIRGLQTLDQPVETIVASARVAVNLPSIPAASLRRGDALVTGCWSRATEIDAHLIGARSDDLPGELMLHIGTAAGATRIRPLGPDAVRLRLPAALPLAPGDRGVLRNPGRQHVLAGIEVVDVEPPALHRRGAARARGAEVSRMLEQGPAERVATEVRRRGVVALDDLARAGVPVPSSALPQGVRRLGEWLVAAEEWESWAARLADLLAERERESPLDPSLAAGAAAQALQLPRREWLDLLTGEAGAEVSGGRVRAVGARPDLGAAAAGLAAIEAGLRERPWSAPEQEELEAAGLTTAHLAAAEQLGRVLRLPGEIVLLPDAPALAMRELTALPQPFTTSQARQVLGSTRRVVIPLLEHLDARGWTRRLDGTLREVAR